MAWLLTAQALQCGGDLSQACLCVAAAAGFRSVAVNQSSARGGIDPEIEAQALRLGMQCVIVNDAAHCRLGSTLNDAQRWSLALALSRDGFDGLILCEACDGRLEVETLHATARVLLRNLDRLDWELNHWDRAGMMPPSHPGIAPRNRALDTVNAAGFEPRRSWPLHGSRCAVADRPKGGAGLFTVSSIGARAAGGGTRCIDPSAAPLLSSWRMRPTP
jgi:hypothetical protein